MTHSKYKNYTHSYYVTGRPPVFDDFDSEILSQNIAAWNERQASKGPRVGDFVLMPNGLYRRFTHDWGDSIQMTCHESETGDHCGSFYLGKGYASYSGSLDPAIPKYKLMLIEGETKEGSFWFFHHNESGAHNGVRCMALCRVWRVQE